MDTATKNCAKCGHGELGHYNATESPNYTHGRTDTRLRRPKNRPCHHRGKHDTRCGCRNFQAAT